MAEPKDKSTETTQPEPKAQGPRRYFIVNPKGTIHEVDREHARERLRIAGWRVATAEEIAAYDAAGGNQVAGKPLAKPWQPDPDAAIDALED